MVTRSNNGSTRFNHRSKKVIRKAVLTLQLYRTQKLAIDARSKGMTSTIAKKLPFKELSSRLRQEPLIKVVKLIIHRVCVLTADGVNVCPEAAETKFLNVRIFLASYMVAWYPKQVFESEGDLEKKLTQAAIEMLAIFDPLCDEIIESENWVDMNDAIDRAIMFPGAFHAYMKAFEAWKGRDEKRLNGRIKHALNALQEADDQLLEYEAGFHSMRSEFRSQKKRLLEKLRQIVGVDEVQMMEDVRIMMGQSAYTTDVAKGCVSMVLDGRCNINMPGENQHRWTVQLPRMTNEQLAHEMLLDPKFEIGDNGCLKDENPAYERMRNTFHQAFWQSLSDDLGTQPTPVYARTIRVFKEISHGIKQLASMAHETATNIDTVIDFDLINQMIENGAFSWETCTELISNIDSVVKQLDYKFISPAMLEADALSNCNGTRKRKTCEEETGRVEENLVAWGIVQRLMQEAARNRDLQPAALCEAMRYLLSTIRSTVTFVTNKRLKSTFPVIRDHGVEYEREHLARKLREKTVSLKNITDLVNFTISNDVSEGRMNIENLTTNDPAKTASYTSVINSVAVELLMDNKTMQATKIPETWLLDSRRIIKMQTAFNFLIRVASVVTITSPQMQGCADKNPMHIFTIIIKRLLSSPDSQHGLEAMSAIVNEELKNHSTMHKDTREKNTQLITTNAIDGGKLHMLFKSRFRNVLLNGLCGDVATFDNNDASLALFAQTKLPRVVHLVSLDVHNIGRSMRPILDLHTKVHSMRYNEIIEAQSKIVALLYAKQ